jgi:proteasome lid subunit RPN8/RPN11
MTFSIKAIIRAFAAPKRRLNCPRRMWQHVVRELERRGERRHESGVFLLGVERGERREVREAIFYDDLDPEAYATGVCVLRGDAFAKLWAICRAKSLTVVADAHTHPGPALQSSSDRANPMVARLGHIAIIIPDFARWPMRTSALGIYEYCGQHEWISRNPAATPGYFYTGLWS